MTNCVFCKIANKEIPCKKILESKDFLAFLDLNPIQPGHALAIPKKHCENLLDFPKNEEEDFFEFLKKTASAIKEATNADGFNIGMNNGIAAGQAVFHAHFHIIPRHDSDGLHHWPGKPASQEELEEMHKKIISRIK